MGNTKTRGGHATRKAPPEKTRVLTIDRGAFKKGAPWAREFGMHTSPYGDYMVDDTPGTGLVTMTMDEAAAAVAEKIKELHPDTRNPRDRAALTYRYDPTFQLRGNTNTFHKVRISDGPSDRSRTGSLLDETRITEEPSARQAAKGGRAKRRVRRDARALKGKRGK